MKIYKNLTKFMRNQMINFAKFMKYYENGWKVNNIYQNLFKFIKIDEN